VRPDLQAALVCEDVRLEVSGSNTLVGVVNIIAAPVMPVRVLKVCVFTRWCSGEGDFVQTTRLLGNEDETELAKCDTRFRLVSEENHATNIAVFGGIEFPVPGDYPVEILLDGDLCLRFPLKVIQAQRAVP
jgi:hypothetical protein